MTISILKAFNGDSILITFQDNDSIKRHILIDGGIQWTYAQFLKKTTEYGDLYYTLKKIKESNDFIDLLIITHTDEDHLGGILQWFNTDVDAHSLIKEVWFNSGRIIANALNIPPNKHLDNFIKDPNTENTSYKQGDELYNYFVKHQIKVRSIVTQGDEFDFYNINFKILSPNQLKLEKLLREWKKIDPSLETSAKVNDYSKTVAEHIFKDKFEEDDALPNGSSIAFVLEFENNKYLFLGDSHPSVIIEGFSKFNFSFPVKFNLTKLAHHGSKANTNYELLELIDSERYIISTNGRIDQHPHKQMLSRILNSKKECNFFFNYAERMNQIFSDEDRKDFTFSTSEITNPFDFTSAVANG